MVLNDTIVSSIADIGVIPVIAVDDVAQAEPLADALIQAGLPLAEITFRTPAAAEVIERMRRARPEMLVGAGTVLTPGDVDRAAAAGARFALSPGLVADTVSRASDRSLPFIPGVMTPADIGMCLNMGIRRMKFFPAMPAGGPDMLSALNAPHAHLHPGFIPTGGVTVDTIPDWFELDCVLAVGGTWIASKQMLADGDWQAVYDNACRAVAAVKACRSPAA
jgi:2-dehydro-3-deoxyphosphogluconate aldolase/(4S)-4-hydroxy-2-oxoglutarate aldolase